MALPAGEALPTRGVRARDRVGLAIYLCVLMHEITDRLRTRPEEVDPADYFARFIGWTRH
ncbi:MULTISPECIES: hypothetical protein [unclassified Micromonospora]|uniref:hypothetical protein n=1 Tax=unclassified Micromonospora TaxID=2617518 RepID=UPI00363D41CD